MNKIQYLWYHRRRLFREYVLCKLGIHQIILYGMYEHDGQCKWCCKELRNANEKKKV